MAARIQQLAADRKADRKQGGFVLGKKFLQFLAFCQTDTPRPPDVEEAMRKSFIAGMSVMLNHLSSNVARMSQEDAKKELDGLDAQFLDEAKNTPLGKDDL